MPAQTPSGESDLLVRFREGEADAIGSVANLARLMVGERGYFIPVTDRDDVVQEIVIHAHRAICAETFEINHGFEALLRTVAHRRCIDWLRREKLRQTEPIPDGVEDKHAGPERVAISHEEILRARAALHALGPRCEKLIRYRLEEGLSYAEIALRLGRTEHGVRTQVYKCLKRLRVRIERKV